VKQSQSYFKIIVLLVLSILTWNAFAQEAKSFSEVLKKMQALSQQERILNAEREAKAVKQLKEQTQRIQQLRSQVKASTDQQNSLDIQYQANEIRIQELRATLQAQQGDIGEVFGVVRQVAGDLHADMTMNIPGEGALEGIQFLADLSERKELPTIVELEGLWMVFASEIMNTAGVVRFEAEVISPDGTLRQDSITRVGPFLAASGNKYLDYSYESSRWVEMGRQPAGHHGNTLQNLSNAKEGDLVVVSLDPTRGSLLKQLVQLPNLWERIQQGKLVGFIILGVGFMGFLLFGERMMFLLRTEKNIKRQLNDLQPRNDNPVGRLLTLYHKDEGLSSQVLEVKIDEAVLGEIPHIERGVTTLKLLGAVAPLLGLLGTVVGMIETFQSITLFGTGDPKLMANGISQALVTTALGLIVAIPLLLLFNIVSSKAKWVIGILEEQAAGILAMHMESKRRDSNG
jgi:biopolymer transport protein ExbB